MENTEELIKRILLTQSRRKVRSKADAMAYALEMSESASTDSDRRYDSTLTMEIYHSFVDNIELPDVDTEVLTMVNALRFVYDALMEQLERITLQERLKNKTTSNKEK